MKKILFIISLVFLGCKSKISSNLSLNNLFSDHMVLQQDAMVNFWGKAKEGSKISVSTSWGEKTSTFADKDGNWITPVQTPEFDNKTHEITIKSSDKSILIKDVVLGEVWLASGQSNMEMPMKGFKYARVHELIEGANQEISNASFPLIRMFTVERIIAYSPVDNVNGQWVVCSPESVSEFSAVAYFFGKKLHQELNVPVGLIHSSWGGSPAESWARTDFIEKIKGFENTSRRLEIAMDPKSDYNRWVADHSFIKRNSLIGVNEFKWVEEKNKGFVENNFNDNYWTETNTLGISKAFEKDDFNGIGWIRQKINVDKIPNKELVFDIGETNDLYTVFINGEMIGRKEYWGVASTKYKFNSEILEKGENTISIRFIDVWGKGGLDPDPNRGIYSGDKKIISLNDQWKLNMICYQTSGDFYILKTIGEKIAIPSPNRMPHQSNSPTTLYNGMIAPLSKYKLKGFIWYQGESNQGRAEQYKTLFPAVIDSWRNQWDDLSLPFYYAQIAPFGGYDNRNGNSGRITSAELRESQMLTMKKSNVGMVITTDLGDLKSIHPPKKKEVGERLAFWALNKDYNFKDIVHSGPIYKSVDFKNGKALVSFDHAESGLYCPDTKIQHFEIAGIDDKYYPAESKIIGNKVMVWSGNVTEPMSVRLGWKNYFEMNLFNKEGLPASSFRTKE